MANSVKKRTRDCPPYKAMYEQSQNDLDVTIAKLSYTEAKLSAEINYSAQLKKLLNRKERV